MNPATAGQQSPCSDATTSTYVYNLPMSDQRVADELRQAQAELALAAHMIAQGNCTVAQWRELERLMTRLGRLAPEIGTRCQPPEHASDQS